MNTRLILVALFTLSMSTPLAAMSDECKNLKKCNGNKKGTTYASFCGDNQGYHCYKDTCVKRGDKWYNDYKKTLPTSTKDPQNECKK